MTLFRRFAAKKSETGAESVVVATWVECHGRSHAHDRCSLRPSDQPVDSEDVYAEPTKVSAAFSAREGVSIPSRLLRRDGDVLLFATIPTSLAGVRIFNNQADIAETVSRVERLSQESWGIFFEDIPWSAANISDTRH